jgi:hypothetical protein
VNEIRQIKAFASKLPPDEPRGSLRSGAARLPLASVPRLRRGDEGVGGDAGGRGRKAASSAVVPGGAGNLFGIANELHHSKFVDPKPIGLCKEFTKLIP